VDTNFVRPFAGTILMLNLADEPAGGDYSSWADAAFRARYGYNQMFARVSASFGLLRRIMATPAGSPDTVLLAPVAPALRAAGRTLALRATDLYNWGLLAALARADCHAVVLTSLDASLPTLHRVFALAAQAGDVSVDDIRVMRTVLAHGGSVVASVPVAAGAERPKMQAAAGGDPPLAVRRYVTASGMLLGVDGGAVEQRPLSMDASRQGLVVTDADGQPVVHETITDRFDRLVARAGVKRITFHGMRHTHATLLLLGGVNIKTVSVRLGHSSIQITLDTYAHALPEMEEQAAEAIGAALAWTA
jgi:hypothetical protein